MGSFKRVKIINGIEYQYEITPYYDPDTKKMKQHSKYIGKMVGGKAKKVRMNLPRNSFDYGEFLPFEKILNDLDIKNTLDELLPEKKSHTVRILALNRLVQPLSMRNIQTWYEKTYYSKEFGELPLSPQALSEFLEALGDSNIASDFSNRLLEKVGKSAPLLYDITSLSSSSKLIDILEWGYNRDGEDLPQMNLSLIAHKDLGIPLSFDIYPGSIVDVSTLRNTISKMTSLGLDKPTLIMDRGFFSGTNIHDLIAAKYDFIIPAPLSLKSIKSLISTCQKDLENTQYLQKYEGDMVFVKPVTLELDDLEINGYLYYDLKREQEEKTLFYERLHDTIDKLQNRTLRKWDKPDRVFEDIAKSQIQYLEWKVKGDRFIVNVKQNAVSQRLNRAGKMIILYSGYKAWNEVLGWNRERDVIEKMFSSMKSDLEILPLRAHKREVVIGMIFVTFISLILRTRLRAILNDTGLSKEYSMISLLLELSKLKRIELADGSMINTQMTKKQRICFEKIGITVE